MFYSLNTGISPAFLVASLILGWHAMSHFLKFLSSEKFDLYLSQQAAESNRKPDQSSRFYAKGALQYLTPLLTDSLKRQVSEGNFFQRAFTEKN